MYNQLPLAQRRVQIAAIFERMAKLYKVPVTDLHKMLGCSAQLLRQHQFYGQMPIELIQQCREVHRVSMDWLIYGEVTSGDALNAQQLDERFCSTVQALLTGLSNSESNDESTENYWHSLRFALNHRAVRLGKEQRRF